MAAVSLSPRSYWSRCDEIFSYERCFSLSFGLGFATLAWSSHQWENYHWAKQKLKVCNLAEDTPIHPYRTLFFLEWADWSVGTELNLVSGCASPDITLSHADYGASGWLGNTSDPVSSGLPYQHLIAANVRVNEFYLGTKDDPCVQGIACHEMGHALGLDHVTTGGCMIVLPLQWCNAWPVDFDAHDVEVVNAINHACGEPEP